MSFSKTLTGKVLNRVEDTALSNHLFIKVTFNEQIKNKLGLKYYKYLLRYLPLTNATILYRIEKLVIMCDPTEIIIAFCVIEILAILCDVIMILIYIIGDFIEN